MTEPDIRDATAADFPRIVALNAAEVAHTSVMDAARLAMLHDAACLHRVAVVDGEVAAFLLAFRDGAHYPNPNFDWFAARYPSFVYVDRVVVDARFSGRGIGSALYRDLFDHVRRIGADVVTCEFNVVPPNEASARFHARWGFVEVGRQWLDDGRKQVSLQAAPASAGASAPEAGSASPPVALAEDPAGVVARLRARAKGGDRDAWFELGMEYLTGKRTPKDMAAAADAFTRGAERGSVECQFNLGVCFQQGDGRPRDAAKALHWFSQAANGGHGEGLFQLAMAYRTGSGVPQDPVAANALMLLAEANGSDEASRAGITDGTLAESTVLMEKIRQPGQLLLTLSRRRTGAVATVDARPTGLPHGAARTTGTGPAVTVDVARAGEVRVGGTAVLALLVGAAGFIVLLLAAAFATGMTLLALAVVLGVVAAFGAYRCSAGLGKPTGMAALLTTLAFVPVVGSFVCLALALQIFRRHRPR